MARSSQLLDTYQDTRMMPVAALHRYPGNARRGNVPELRKSLRRHGQYRALIVQDRTGLDEGYRILAGNHTFDGLTAEGATEVRCEIHVMDDDLARRINVADNRQSELGFNDNGDLLELLSYFDGDLEGLGYSDDDVTALLEAIGGNGDDDDDETPPRNNDPDETPEPEETAPPVSTVGDVWSLGPHRLAVGDSTDPTVWRRLLGDERADLVWTDPPYGVSYVGKTEDALTIQNDSLSPEELTEFLGLALGAALDRTRPGACWYVASPPGPLLLAFGTVLQDLGVWRQTLTWVKDQFVMGRSDYHYRHEPVFYGWTPGAAHQAVPDRKQDSVHEVPRPKSSKLHPTMKPVDLIVRHIENSTNSGDLVIDPFGGSGSTLIACHGTGRRAALIELDPKYADVICRRYQEHTGVIPTRDGVPFDFEAHARDLAEL